MGSIKGYLSSSDKEEYICQTKVENHCSIKDSLDRIAFIYKSFELDHLSDIKLKDIVTEKSNYKLSHPITNLYFDNT